MFEVNATLATEWNHKYVVMSIFLKGCMYRDIWKVVTWFVFPTFKSHIPQ